MKHYDKAKEILNEDFFTQIESLSRKDQHIIKNMIDELIEKGEEKQVIAEAANGLSLMFYGQMGYELIRSKHDNISEGINWLSRHGKWTDLKQISVHAIEKAIETCEAQGGDVLAAKQCNFFKLKLNLLNGGISDFSRLIGDMKQMMVDEGILHWLKAIKDKPDSTYATGWKSHAKELIEQLYNMDDVVNIPFENGSLLRLVRDKSNWGNLGYVDSIMLFYGEKIEGMDYYNAHHTQYFPVKNLDEAIQCFIDRYLSEQPYNEFGKSYSLEECKEMM